jgi:hypothetical protein
MEEVERVRGEGERQEEARDRQRHGIARIA